LSVVSLSPPVASASRARSLAAAATGVGLAAAIVLAALAARHASPSEVSPVVPRGDWSTAWTVALYLAFVCYGLGAWMAHAGWLRLRIALVTAVAVQVVPLAAPLLLSKDVFLYWGEARVVTVHHANPYRATPADYPADPAFTHISESWRAEPTPYGPAWVAVGTVPALAAGTSAHRAELAYRALAVAALLASIVLVALRTRNAAAVAFLGWSPLLALHFAGGGHSDAVMMLLVLGAVAAGASALGGALWPLASAFKPFPPILVPLELAKRRLHVGARWWLGLVASTVAVAALATAFLGTAWIHAATTGAHQASPLGGVHWLTQLGLTHRNAVVAAAAVFLVVYVALLRDAWRHGRAHLSLAASALCLTSSLLRPWYAVWPVALAALEEDAAAAVVAYALTGYLLFGDAVQL
jgi:alpha-1,6-mannosyltransferase